MREAPSQTRFRRKARRRLEPDDNFDKSAVLVDLIELHQGTAHQEFRTADVHASTVKQFEKFEKTFLHSCLLFPAMCFS